jgi:hypothetical protein
MAREPTFEDVDALVGPATPHFAYQLRARVRALIRDLPEDHPVRKYGEEKMELLDRLGDAHEPRARVEPAAPKTSMNLLAVTLLASRAPRAAATRRVATSSVAPVASGYERSLRPSEARFSRPMTATCSGGGRADF